MRTLNFVVHTAYLDPMTGSGLLVQPHPDEDIDPPDGILGERVWLPSIGQYGHQPALSLHWADWESAMRELHQINWSLLEGDDGLPEIVGSTNDGRQAIGLYCEDSLISSPTIPEIDSALRELSRLAGVNLQ